MLGRRVDGTVAPTTFYSTSDGFVCPEPGGPPDLTLINVEPCRQALVVVHPDGVALRGGPTWAEAARVGEKLHPGAVVWAQERAEVGDVGCFRLDTGWTGDAKRGLEVGAAVTCSGTCE
mgnify:CR=1 FL=1